MSLILHYNNLVFVESEGYKRVKDLNVGDKILVHRDLENLFLTPIKSLLTLDYNSWYKIQLSNEESFILDRELFLFVETRGFLPLKEINNSNILSYPEDNISISFKKEFNKSSIAYQIELEEEVFGLSLNDLIIKL